MLSSRLTNAAKRPTALDTATREILGASQHHAGIIMELNTRNVLKDICPKATALLAVVHLT